MSSYTGVSFLLGQAQQHDHWHHPGDTASVSGLYRVYHAGHRGDHDVLVLAGETFPACRACGRMVGFDLIRSIEHIAHDWDFTGPNLRLIYSRDRDNQK